MNAEIDGQLGICESCTSRCLVWNIRGWWLCVFCHKRETGGV